MDGKGFHLENFIIILLISFGIIWIPMFCLRSFWIFNHFRAENDLTSKVDLRALNRLKHSKLAWGAQLQCTFCPHILLHSRTNKILLVAPLIGMWHPRLDTPPIHFFRKNSFFILTLIYGKFVQFAALKRRIALHLIRSKTHFKKQDTIPLTNLLSL